jgi:hypothetical protein
MFNNIMYNLVFKNINFNYKFLNKINSNYISSTKNSILQLNNLGNLTNYKKNIVPKKLNFYKIKSSFFFFINSKLIQNFNTIKSLLYLKKKNIFNLNNITKFLKKLYFKVDFYKRTNNYLFIY